MLPAGTAITVAQRVAFTAAVYILALGLGWLEALQWHPPTLPTQFSRSAFGFGNLVPFESSLRWGALFWICGPRLLNVATGGVWDLFVLLPKILGCWGFFARAFLLGRLGITITSILKKTCVCARHMSAYAHFYFKH